MADRGATATARRLCAGAHQAGERPRCEDRLRKFRRADGGSANSRPLRHAARSERRPRADRVTNPGAGAESSPDSNYRRSGDLLARQLSEDQERAAAKISETRVAMIFSPRP